jgi:hypothetical protein
MSGSNFTETCPRCGGVVDVYSEWKPHSHVSGQHLECGYQFWTETGRLSLEEVNELRAEMEQKPLKRRKGWRCEKAIK